MDNIFPPDQYGDYDKLNDKIQINESIPEQVPPAEEDKYNSEIEDLLKQYTENDIQHAVKSEKRFKRDL